MVFLDNNEDLNPYASVLYSDIFKVFKRWFKEKYTKCILPDTKTVKNELIQRLGSQGTNKRWHRITLNDF